MAGATATKPTSAIGLRTPRFDAADKVTARYLNDVTSGRCWPAFLWRPIHMRPRHLHRHIRGRGDARSARCCSAPGHT